MKSTTKSRAENTARRRLAVIDAALDVFTEKGFAAARMEDIARQAGVAKGTIYLQFRDKEALFEAIVRQEISPFVGALGSGLAPGETVRAFLHRTVLPFLQDLHRSRRGAIIRLMIAEAGRFPKLAKLYFRMVVEPGLTIFGKLARRARKTGELRNAAVVQFPQLMIAPALVALLWPALFERYQHLDVEGMLRAHFDQLFSTSSSDTRS
jgi:AcrR family transcriptional regulator